ncbi:MAG: hypothetical protein WCT99_10685 [Bacteroidota bacterium]|jgi:hypothetical protein
MDPEALQSIIVSLTFGKPTYDGILRIVHYSRSIAESYLLHHRASVLRLCEINGISLTDLATDIIGDIFEKNSENKFIHIDSFVHQLAKPVDEIDPRLLQTEFRTFVYYRSKRQLARTYSQSDPVWAKIFRNLKIHLQKHPDLRLAEDFRGFVVEPAADSAQDHLPEFPPETVEQRLFAEVRTIDTIPHILKSLAGILCAEKNFRRSIPLAELVRIVRVLYVQNFDRDVQPEDVEISSEEIASIQKTVFEDLDRKILSDYLLKGKLNSREAKIMSDTLREVMTGWWSGDGDEFSIARITQKNFGVSQQEYKKLYQSKIEYLARIAKERVAQYIEKNL